MRLEVVPKTSDVDCSGQAGGSFYFSGTGQDAKGYALQIGGGCSTFGAFYYYLTDGTAADSVDGTISTAVAQSMAIGGEANFKTDVCEITCDKTWVADVSGTASWKITGISPAGASFKTDSGSKY